MTIEPPPAPPRVEILAIVPLASTKLPVARKNCPAVMSTAPPTAPAPPWALMLTTCTSPMGSKVTFPPLPMLPLESIAPAVMAVRALKKMLPPVVLAVRTLPVVMAPLRLVRLMA